jgi:hypothetical protein
MPRPSRCPASSPSAVGAIVVLAAACGGGSTAAPAPTPTLALSFARVPGPGLDAIEVAVGVAGSAATPTVTVDRGSLGGLARTGDGSFVTTLLPTTTGEYRVTATIGTTSLVRTALVLQDVHADWGQPQSVAGLVNTDGYEDGVTIAPDGQTLFVQYGPYRWSSLLVFQESRANGGCGGNRLVPDRCTHPWLDTTIGPLAGPERPGFFTGRFAGTTQLHNAASFGIGPDGAPILALTTMFYGFRRQPDGSFAAPFSLAFDDLGDGIVGPFGLAFQPLGGDSHRAVFTLKDAATVGNGFDAYICDVVFGTGNVLGSYAASTPGNPPVRIAPFPSTLLDLGDNTGTQGNPSLYFGVGGDVRSVWTDDEYDGDADTGRITAHVLGSGVFPSSNDFTAVVLPGVVNVPGTTAIQPTFRDEGLYFTQDTSIAFAAYAGSHDAAALGNGANWSAPVTLLQKDTTIASLRVTTADLGKIVAIGEPTVAVVDGRRVLYFVYAWVRGIDPVTGFADLDFQAGFVPAAD